MAVMEDTRQQLIAKLKTCKEQGLTFYQASQQLQQQGYIQAQITNAADQFNYKNPVANGSSADLVKREGKMVTPASSPAGSEMDRDYQKMGNAILADKERSERPYAYVALAITAGYLGQSIYRFWLTRKFWGSSGNPRYLWANNLGYYLLAGVIGAGLAILGLKLYFRSKDRLYKRIDKSLSPPQDN
jgi:hypothetical protein